MMHCISITMSTRTTLSLSVAPEVVVMTTYGATNDDKVGIMTTLSVYNFNDFLILLQISTDRTNCQFITANYCQCDYLCFKLEDTEIYTLFNGEIMNHVKMVRLQLKSKMAASGHFEISRNVQ